MLVYYKTDIIIRSSNETCSRHDIAELTTDLIINWTMQKSTFNMLLKSTIRTSIMNLWLMKFIQLFK